MVGHGFVVIFVDDLHFFSSNSQRRFQNFMFHFLHFLYDFFVTLYVPIFEVVLPLFYQISRSFVVDHVLENMSALVELLKKFEGKYTAIILQILW